MDGELPFNRQRTNNLAVKAIQAATQGSVMNKDQVTGKVDQVTGKVKQKAGEVNMSISRKEAASEM